MAELQNVQHMLADAKRAANAGELASADALLHDAARIQEAELGALHPELANTVNNLAIVAEMEGRFGDAETYYRRAVAIASASLPFDDPMVASSRQNLEGFCLARGLPFDASAGLPSLQRSEPRDRVAPDPSTGAANTSAGIEVAGGDLAARTSTPAPNTRSVSDSTTHAADRSSFPAAATARSFAIVTIGLVALAAVAILVMRPWSARESPVPTPAPIEQPQPPGVASRDARAVGSAVSAPAPGRSSGAITLVTSQLCRTLSVGGNWRCDPAGQSVTPGAIVLYTRVKSPRDAIVIHRWYRGNALRKTARLAILANRTDGYRTYSRQTVKGGEDWRVEVRNTAGNLLYEQRVSVQ